MSGGHDQHHAHGLAGPAQRKKIITVFLILSAITAVEFAIAFMMGRGMGRNMIFIGMTLVKAFYIVAEFMHLRHEVKRFVYVILLPLLFLIWFIIAMLVEGNFMFELNGINGWFR